MRSCYCADMRIGDAAGIDKPCDQMHRRLTTFPCHRRFRSGNPAVLGLQARRSVALRPNLSIGLPFSVVVLFPRESPFLAAALAAKATVARLVSKKTLRKLNTYIMYSRSPGSLYFCRGSPSTRKKCPSAGWLYVRLPAVDPANTQLGRSVDSRIRSGHIQVLIVLTIILICVQILQTELSH